jgi:hypothetical protein
MPAARLIVSGKSAMTAVIFQQRCHVLGINVP